MGRIVGEDLAARLFGTEVDVERAAAATVVVLNALAAGGETIVSRGELVEIGGSFRIPDILEKSGSVLIEVGTTNRTKLGDYVGAISPRTKCALKVHRSNFRLSGFVTEVQTRELVETMSSRNIPVVHDVGSGLLVDLTTVVVALTAVGLAGLVLVSISYLVLPRVRQVR